MKNRPLVIKDLGEKWRARSKWNFDYFREVMGGETVEISVVPDGRADAVVGGKFQLPEDRKMRFGEFLDFITGKYKPEDGGVYYLQKQNSCLTQDYPKLAVDMPSEVSFGSLAFGSGPDAVNLWIGGAASVSSLHRDPYENIYTVIRGRKVFKLFPPTYRSKIVYKEYDVVRCHFDNERKKWSRRPEPGTESIRWVEKSADQTGIDPITVEVREGETLYLPVGWFHEVHQSDGTIAVNYWYDRSYDQNYTKEKFIDQIAELIEDQ